MSVRSALVSPTPGKAGVPPRGTWQTPARRPKTTIRLPRMWPEFVSIPVGLSDDDGYLSLWNERLGDAITS